ncbi:MAG: hypothetical protein HUU55_10000 [Myxococcales bacterium]|nr:hypothetical protein [Myxococcales bacterium]
MKSFRQSLESAHPELDFSKGVKNRLLSHHTPEPGETFPFPTARQIMTAAEWPAGYTYLGNYPDEIDAVWTEDVQGGTHDDSFWYISQASRIWKFPKHMALGKQLPRPWPHNCPGLPGPAANVSGIGFNLASILPESLEVSCLPIPPHLVTAGYDHWGDLDYYAGNLFVPLERDGNKDPLLMVVVAAAELTVIATGELPASHDHAAWCAINPLNGLLYTSEMFHAVSHITVYRWSIANATLTLTKVADIALHDASNKSVVIKRVQGGVFSKLGHLYLVSDSENSGAGVYGFDGITGLLQRFVPIRHNPSFTYSEELEGITIWDGSAAGIPGFKGQIHVFALDNDWPLGSDDAYVKHIGVSADDSGKL